MATLTVADAVLTGLNPGFVAAAGGGDKFANNGQCLILVQNDDVAAKTVTIDDPVTQSPRGASAFNPDVAVVVPAGEQRVLGPFPPFRFNDSSGYVNIAYSAVTSVTVSVVRLRS